MYTPVNPSFTILKWGVRGSSLHGLVYVMNFKAFYYQDQVLVIYRSTVPGVWFVLVIMFSRYTIGCLLPAFCVRVSVTFHRMCVYIIFSSVSVAEWPPFWEIAAHLVDLMLTICKIGYFPFWF